MKRFVQQMVCAVALVVVVSTPSFSLESIAVMDLKAIGTDQSLAEAVSENLRTMLIVSGAFKVVERSQIEEILGEYKLAQGGLTDHHAVRIGDMAEAGRILIGSITRMFNNYTINARLLDVKTGVCLLGQMVDIDSEADFPRKIDELAAFFSSKSLSADDGDGTPDISGTYQVKGSDYVGRLRISKHKETYQISWGIDNSETKEADQSFTGVGILHNNMLSVNYVEEGDKTNTGVAIYEVLLDGKRLRGLYTSIDNAKATGSLRFENGEKIPD